MSNIPTEKALNKYALTHPECCEISFRAGWQAGEHHERAVRGEATQRARLGANHKAWRSDITEKYNEAKKLFNKGYTKIEACQMVGLAYDNYMRRQRLEIFGRDRLE